MREDEYDGVHTCHANCKKWYCVLRKERDRYREALSLMADGEGDDPAVYRQMAKAALEGKDISGQSTQAASPCYYGGPEGVVHCFPQPATTGDKCGCGESIYANSVQRPALPSEE